MYVKLYRNFLAVYSGNIRKSPTHHEESIDSAVEPSIKLRIFFCIKNKKSKEDQRIPPNFRNVQFRKLLTTQLGMTLKLYVYNRLVST